MEELHGFPYFRVEFNKLGEIVDPEQVKALTDFLRKGETTDLFVISHGWNNDMEEAHRDLYTPFFQPVRHLLDQGAVAGLEARRFAVMAVFWPSHKFAEKEFIPGGAAGLDSPLTDDFIEEQLEDLKLVLDTPEEHAALEKAKNLVPNLEDSKKARAEFADLMRSMMPKTITPDVDGATEFSELPGDKLIEVLSKPVDLPIAETGGGASLGEEGGDMSMGGAAGIGKFFSGIKAGAAHLLNLVTFYQMKERSSLVGSTGVNEVLQAIRKENPNLKMHLIGHSFGARLLTSAVAGKSDQGTLKVNSLALLQAGLSHYGFSDNYDDLNSSGFFRRVVTSNTISGPVLISHTKNDLPISWGYALASRLAGQEVAAGLGDEKDKYGSLGRNGAQKTPEAINEVLLDLGNPYVFQAGKLHNLNSDEFIKGHSDICNKQVAYALLNGVSIT